MIAVYAIGFPHSDISGSQVVCHLPEAFRRLPRLSSALLCQVIHRMPLRASSIRLSELKTRYTISLAVRLEIRPEVHNYLSD